MVSVLGIVLLVWALATSRAAQREEPCGRMVCGTVPKAPSTNTMRTPDFYIWDYSYGLGQAHII